LVHGGIVGPDQLALLLALLALGCALHAFHSGGGGPSRWIVTAGLLAGAAVSAKEPYFLTTVILAVWAFVAIGSKKRALRFAAILCCTTLLVFALEHAFFRIWTGDWLYRYRALTTTYGTGPLSVTPLSLGRFTYYSNALLNPAVSGMLGPLAVLGAVAVLRGIPHRGIILLWSAAFFVFLQFGSTGLSTYKPLPLQLRYMHPIIILLFIPVGVMLRDLARHRPLRVTGAVTLLALLSIHALAIARDQSGGLYYSDIPRSVRHGIHLQAQGLVSTMTLPADALRRLPVDMRRAVTGWTTVTLLDGLDQEDTDALVTSEAFLLPHVLELKVLDHATLDVLDSLRQSRRVEQVLAAATPLDRLLHAAPLSIVARRARFTRVGALYWRTGAD
jgi:hypothetical protein